MKQGDRKRVYLCRDDEYAPGHPKGFYGPCCKRPKCPMCKGGNVFKVRTVRLAAL